VPFVGVCAGEEGAVDVGVHDQVRFVGRERPCGKGCWGREEWGDEGGEGEDEVWGEHDEWLAFAISGVSGVEGLMNSRLAAVMKNLIYPTLPLQRVKYRI